MSNCFIALTATKLDKDEQGKIAQVGLEVKLITAEMDAEAEKWNESNNEIIKVNVTVNHHLSFSMTCSFASAPKICRRWRIPCICLRVVKAHYVQPTIFSLRHFISSKKEVV